MKFYNLGDKTLETDFNFSSFEAGGCEFRNNVDKLVNLQWKRSADPSKEVPATFRSKALEEVPASEALRACTSFDYFICNIPVVICKLDLVFCF